VGPPRRKTMPERRAVGREPRKGSAPSLSEGRVDVQSLLRDAAGSLTSRAGDRSGARLEAEVLLGFVLGVERSSLLTQQPILQEQSAAFHDLVGLRVDTGRPVAYLVGHRGFRDLDVLVDERVLVPRPETEHVIEVLLDLKASGLLPPGPVVDRGTGSGALALTLARTLEGMVVGIDLSGPALEVARLNEEALGDAGGRPVPLVQSDCLSCFADHSLAAVVANPPYIAAEDFEGLPVDVQGHEPRVALVPKGGCPGSHYAALIEQAGRVLVSGGWLVTEVGEGQAHEVAERFESAHWSQIGLTDDLAGIARVVHAQSL